MFLNFIISFFTEIHAKAAATSFLVLTTVGLGGRRLIDEPCVSFLSFELEKFRLLNFGIISQPLDFDRHNVYASGDV